MAFAYRVVDVALRAARMPLMALRFLVDYEGLQRPYLSTPWLALTRQRSRGLPTGPVSRPVRALHFFGRPLALCQIDTQAFQAGIGHSASE